MKSLPCTALAAALLATLAACGASQRHSTATSTQSKGTPAMQRSYCAGRFQFSAPEDFVLAGRSQSIFDVDVETRTDPPEAVRKERSARIQSLKAPAGASRAVIRTFEIIPGTPAVLYHRNERTSELQALEALRTFPGHVFIASRELDLRGAPANATEIIETLVRNVLNAYRPSTERGFCVGLGAVTGESGDDEQTLLTLETTAIAPLKDATIRFRTYMVAQPDNTTHSNLDEESRLGAPLTVIKEGSRTAAGVEGKEYRLALEPSNEPAIVRFTWHFPGIPARPDLPAIDITASAPKTQISRLEPVWESFLDSIRKVPMQ